MEREQGNKIKKGASWFSGN